MSEDDSQKADELITVGAWVLLVVGWVEAGMEVVGGMHAVRCQRTSQVQGDTLMTPDHSAVPVRSSG